MVNVKSAKIKFNFDWPNLSPKYKCYSIIEELGANSVPAHPKNR